MKYDIVSFVYHGKVTNWQKKQKNNEINWYLWSRIRIQGSKNAKKSIRLRSFLTSFTWSRSEHYRFWIKLSNSYYFRSRFWKLHCLWKKFDIFQVITFQVIGSYEILLVIFNGFAAMTVKGCAEAMRDEKCINAI